MDPLEPRGLCLREGDLVILERKPLAPPPELVELMEPSRWKGSVMLFALVGVGEVSWPRIGPVAQAPSPRITRLCLVFCPGG